MKKLIIIPFLFFSLFLSATNSMLYINGPPTIGGTLAMDYNLYWNSTYATPFKLSGTERNWAYWTGTLTYDTNSPNVGHGDADLDPLFKNAGGSYLLELDFDLQTTSPCINAGVDVTIDYLGPAPDIGRYEKR